MKKHIIFISALLLTASALSGCHYDIHIHDPKPESSSVTVRKLTEIDPFEGFDITSFLHNDGRPEEKDLAFSDPVTMDVDGHVADVQMLKDKDTEGLRKCRDLGCDLIIYREILPDDLRRGNTVTYRTMLKMDQYTYISEDISSYLEDFYRIKLTQTSKDVTADFKDEKVTEIDPFRNGIVKFNWGANGCSVITDFTKSNVFENKELKALSPGYDMSLEEGEDIDDLYIGEKVKFTFRITADGKTYYGEDVNKYLDDNYAGVRLKKTEKIYTVLPDNDALRYQINVNVSLDRPDNWHKIISDKNRFTKTDLRHIDGSTATIPITAELFRQYCNINDREIQFYVDHNTTGPAYQNLILGENNKNIILVTEPSQAELEMAKQNNVELEVTPIALDGFVFITHKDNPVDSLTVEQIQGIYSGAITNWKELGGNDEEIMAYQREPDSGSQTVMENMVMKDIPLVSPPMMSPPSTMGELVEYVATYRNKTCSIGYSFYYYLNNLYKNADIKVLKINGVSPDNENLINKTYPFSSGYYAVTVKGRDKKADEIKDYLVSDEGQEIIKLAGYCPVK